MLPHYFSHTYGGIKMSNSNKKKTEQLGMPHGTAAGRLRKSIMFNLIKQCGHDICFQCKKTIEKEEDLSIEHKIPWLDSEKPKELFFDLDNISFSHLKCNIAQARQPLKVHFTDKERRLAKNKQNIEYSKRLGKEERQKRRRAEYIRRGE